MCLPARCPLEPTTSVLIDDELVAVDCEALRAAGGQATRKPGGMRDRLAVGWLLSSWFLCFNMRGGG